MIYKSKDIIVLYKPSGIPTVPLKNSSGETFLSRASAEYPEILSVYGKNPWEGGILHRLDTPTRGLVIAARNQEAYDFMMKEQDEDRILKIYRATVAPKDKALEGFPAFPYDDVFTSSVDIKSKFRSFGPGARAVRPVTDNKRFQEGRDYLTSCDKESDSSILCRITRGFRHQIRCHMAWSGYPIVGDELYGGASSDVFGLEAIGLSFTDPGSGKRVDILI